jgi:hypothetical protein
MYEKIQKPILAAHQELAEMIAGAQYLQPCELAVLAFEATYKHVGERAALHAADLREKIAARRSELSGKAESKIC